MSSPNKNKTNSNTSIQIKINDINATHLHQLIDLSGSPITDELEVVTIHHSLAGVPNFLEELVVLPADLLEGVGVRVLELRSGLAREDFVLELALLPTEGPALLVGLARLLHHLDLFAFLLLAATAAAAAAAAAALLLGNDSSGIVILRIFVGTLLLVPVAFLATLGVVGRTLVALVLVVGIGHGGINMALRVRW